MSSIYNFFDDQCPDYIDEIFSPAEQNGVSTCSSNKKLKLPSRKTKLALQSVWT